MFPVAHALNPAGWTHLLAFGVLIPLLALGERRKVLGTGSALRELPNRLVHFRRTALTLVLFLTISLLVARVQWITLFPAALPPLAAMVAGVALYALAVAYMRPRWRRAVERRARVVHLFMPATGEERAWWVAVSVLAGIGEEITWRGVQAALLYALTGNLWAAALLSALSFGMAHIVQGWRSAAVIIVFALGFHVLVGLAGSLYVAMAVHVAYDITAGIQYGRLGRELGYLADASADASAASADAGASAAPQAPGA
jgi:membrane protease YdiL (CAAX protease family)